MKILYSKSKWERPEFSLGEFLDACKVDGYDATEIYIPALKETPREIAQAHRAAGLGLVAQIVTNGATAAEHMASLERLVPLAAACEPLHVNCHTGCDWYGIEDNLRIFRHANKLAAEHGVVLMHETHRGRALFNVPDALRYLDACPDLAITADFSHWFCVHESDLYDQEISLARIIKSVRHIHARVGHREGPQIADPASPAAAPWIARHIELWQRIVDARRKAGASHLTITPEFGPPPYMPVFGENDTPAGDAWERNRWMLAQLKAKLT